MSKVFKTSAFFLLLISLFFFSTVSSQAQGNESLTFSITPPLYKINMKPGESWSSSIKVNNNNSYPASIYVQVMDFRPSGESGGVEFIEPQAADGSSKNTLSRWIEISKAPVEVAPSTSIDIPFTVSLPATADPGGHYAAILAGNKPPDNTTGNTIKFSSKLASLLLVRVSGDIIEQGAIREFTSAKRFNTGTNASFVVRFANDGNVHLQPQGQITVYNMFGKVRGVIPINQKTDYGNVLPDSEKKWAFDWQGTSSLLDAGRMKADLVLSFGVEAKQSDFRTIYFWTVDWKPTLAVFGGILFLVLALIFFIRRYIKKSLEAARLQAGLTVGAVSPARNDDSSAAARPAENTPAPGGKSIINLRASSVDAGAADNETDKHMNWSFFKTISVLLLVVALAVAGVFAYKYFAENSSDTPAAEVVERENTGNEPADQAAGTDQNADNGAGGLKVLEAATSTASSTPIEAASSTEPVPPLIATSSAALPATVVIDKKEITLTVKNGSGIAGAASKMAALLETAGYNKANLGNADNFSYQTTEIIYGKSLEKEARNIDELLGKGNLLSEDPNFEKQIIIIIGKNYK